MTHVLDARTRPASPPSRSPIDRSSALADGVLMPCFDGVDRAGVVLRRVSGPSAACACSPATSARPSRSAR